MGDEFEWDLRKERQNRLKHGVGFDEATTVFEDLGAWVRRDEAHSDGEERYIIIGLSALGRFLVVVHVHRGERIRIISARKASPGERRGYEQN